MNILLLFIELIILFLVIYYSYKKNKYEVLYMLLIILTLLVGIFSNKEVMIFNLNINYSFIISSIIILITKILIQKKGPEEIKNILLLITFTSIITYILLETSSLLQVSNINKKLSVSYNEVFNLNSRTYLSAVASLILSAYLTSVVYHNIRIIKNKIWLSNALTSIILELIDSTIFCLISYLFKIPFINLIELIVIRYILKLIISLLGTSLIYSVNEID